MAKPHLCPVCQGRGTVSEGFYLRGGIASSASLCRETCRTCQGFGMVWDYTDQTPGPGWSWIGPVTCQDINKTVTSPAKPVTGDHFTNMGEAECDSQSIK